MFLHSCMTQFNIFLLSYAMSSLLDFVSLKAFILFFHKDMYRIHFPYEMLFAYRTLYNLTPSRCKSHLVAHVKGPI